MKNIEKEIRLDELILRIRAMKFVIEHAFDRGSIDFDIILREL